MTRTLIGFYATCLLLLAPQIAFAMITGSEGNENVNDHRLPKGAGAIINRKDRIATWEGEQEFHADGLGDTEAIKAIVTDFGKLDVKTKRLVVHDGIGQSYLLNMDLQSDLKKDARINWTFQVWPDGKWEHSQNFFTRRNRPPREKPDLPAQIDIFTSNIRWSDVVIPPGIEVIDERLEAHGFTADDGIVIEGNVKELVGGLPLVATIRIERIELKNGGYVYTNIADTKSNTNGDWVLKNAPAAWMRIVAEADNHVPRVIGFLRCYEQPQWNSIKSSLSRAVSISGRVTDSSGVPLADVVVRLDEVIDESGHNYRSPSDFKFTTNAEGKFQSDQGPPGEATVWLTKSGYIMGGLGESVRLPANSIELQLLKAGNIRVTVDFNGKKPPKGYMVELTPEGGNVIGSYGGSATIDEKNAFTFKNVRPGKYVVKGHPNPTTDNEITESVNVDLESRDAARVTIKAK